MKIAIIGSGNVGGALATRWSAKGHHILLGVRDINSFKGKTLFSNPNTFLFSIIEAVEKADVILIAAVPQAISDIIMAMGNVKGKIIIDAMNSVMTKPEGYNNSFEALLDMAIGAEIVKCFNTTGYENMINPLYNGEGIDMFMAGNSEQAKKIAKQLALDAGFAECYDFGGSDKADLLEKFALSWINLAIMRGYGRNIAFKVIKR
jgi:8-hydroxy-5-deazaflavin:NADPH oxidoreductase